MILLTSYRTKTSVVKTYNKNAIYFALSRDMLSLISFDLISFKLDTTFYQTPKWYLRIFSTHSCQYATQIWLWEIDGIGMYVPVYPTNITPNICNNMCKKKC